MGFYDPGKFAMFPSHARRLLLVVVTPRMESMTPQRASPGQRHATGYGLRLFRVGRRGQTLTEIPKHFAALERSLQRLMERHLSQLLDVQFLASEYATGTRQQGRIDTLGVDRHGAPVVVEYKRAFSANLINQGLYYLDWLDEHRGEFRLLVQERLGVSFADTITWSDPRLICVAAEFHRYDVRAVRQIKCRVDLLRYEWFGDDLLFLLTHTAPSV